MNHSIIIAAICVLTSVGCVTPNKQTDRAIDAFKHGDWRAAMATFEELEEDDHDRSTGKSMGTLFALNERWFLRYHVFRGMGHWLRYQDPDDGGELSDLKQAHRHLTKGLELHYETQEPYLRADEERAARAVLDEVLVERERLVNR